MLTTDVANQTSLAIDRSRDSLAEAITNRHYELQPELEQRYGPAGRAKCLQDANFHLSYLSEAVKAKLPSLFGDYVAWAKVMLESRRVPAQDLVRNLEVIRDTLRDRLPDEASQVTNEYIDWGIARLSETPGGVPSQIQGDTPLAQLARHYLDSLLRKDSRIDTILLGCTHYALIEGMLRHWVPFQIGLVSQGAIVADKLTDYLRRHPDIEERLDRAGRETFLSTEYSPRIERLATQFFGRPVKIDAVRLAV